MVINTYSAVPRKNDPLYQGNDQDTIQKREEKKEEKKRRSFSAVGSGFLDGLID